MTAAIGHKPTVAVEACISTERPFGRTLASRGSMGPEALPVAGLVRALRAWKELNPAVDLHNRAAVHAVDLIKPLFGKSTLMRRRAESSSAAQTPGTHLSAPARGWERDPESRV